MKISFIIPVYNAEKFIEKCINSILAQGLQHDVFEIITVNDGSTDNSLSVLSTLKEKIPQLSIINKANSGAGASRNTGIKASTGEIITFIDADDYLEDNCIPGFIEIFDQNQLDLFCFETISIRGRHTYITKSISTDYNTIYAGEQFLLNYINGFGPCARLYKRSLFFDNSFFFPEDTVPEDIELIPKLILASERVMIQNVAAYNYVFNPGSVTKIKNDKVYKHRIAGLLYVAKSLHNFSLKYKETNLQVYNYLRNQIINKVIAELFYFVEYRTYINAKYLQIIFIELKKLNLIPFKTANAGQTRLYLFNFPGLFKLVYFFRLKRIYYISRALVIKLAKIILNRN